MKANDQEMRGPGWIWPVWLTAVAGSFAVLEGRAIHAGEDTLSRATWKTTKAWPPLAVVYGMLFGGLAVHFFWTNEGLDIPRSE
jgi:hypothetical protein